MTRRWKPKWNPKWKCPKCGADLVDTPGRIDYIPGHGEILYPPWYECPHDCDISFIFPKRSNNDTIGCNGTV